MVAHTANMVATCFLYNTAYLHPVQNYNAWSNACIIRQANQLKLDIKLQQSQGAYTLCMTGGPRVCQPQFEPSAKAYVVSTTVYICHSSFKVCSVSGAQLRGASCLFLTAPKCNNQGNSAGRLCSCCSYALASPLQSFIARRTLQSSRYSCLKQTMLSSLQRVSVLDGMIGLLVSRASPSEASRHCHPTPRRKRNFHVAECTMSWLHACRHA